MKGLASPVSYVIFYQKTDKEVTIHIPWFIARQHTPPPVHIDPKRPAWLWAPSYGAAPSVCGRWKPSSWRPPHWLSPSTPGSTGCWSAASYPAFSDILRLCMGLRPYHPPTYNREWIWVSGVLLQLTEPARPSLYTFQEKTQSLT